MSQLWIFLLQVYSLMGLLALFFLWKSCFREQPSFQPTTKATSTKKQCSDHDKVLKQVQNLRAHKVATEEHRVQQLTAELASLKAMQKQVREQLSELQMEYAHEKGKDHPPLKTD